MLWRRDSKGGMWTATGQDSQGCGHLLGLAATATTSTASTTRPTIGVFLFFFNGTGYLRCPWRYEVRPSLPLRVRLTVRHNKMRINNRNRIPSKKNKHRWWDEWCWRCWWWRWPTVGMFMFLAYVTHIHA